MMHESMDYWSEEYSSDHQKDHAAIECNSLTGPIPPSNIAALSSASIQGRPSKIW
jgi:hypothetical protein